MQPTEMNGNGWYFDGSTVNISMESYWIHDSPSHLDHRILVHQHQLLRPSSPAWLVLLVSPSNEHLRPWRIQVTVVGVGKMETWRQQSSSRLWGYWLYTFKRTSLSYNTMGAFTPFPQHLNWPIQPLTLPAYHQGQLKQQLLHRLDL